jgi:hypothetical protein
MTIVDRADGPADDEPGIEIQNHRQVGFPVLADAEFARVPDPPLIGSLRREVLLQQVVGHRLIVIAVGRHLVPLAHTRVEAFLLLQADNPLPTDVFPPLEEVIVNAWAAVIATTARERGVQQDFESSVFLRPAGLRPGPRRIEPARRHAPGSATG